MYTLLYFPLMAAVFFGLGRLCLWRVGFARAAEAFVFSSALGMAVLGYGVFALGAIGRMTPTVVAIGFGLCAAISLPVVARYLARLSWKRPRLGALEWLCLAILVGAAVLNLLVTLNPFLEHDSYEYHVPVAKAWLVAGRFFAMPYYLQSNYHMLAELLNVVALSISPNDMALCKLVSWYSGLLLAVATWCFGRSFFSARSAWVAAAVVYLVKEVSWLSGTAYIDLTHGLFVWLGIFAMIRALHVRGTAWFALAGVFFGGAFATKQTGALYFAMAWAACGLVLALEPRRRGQLGRWLGGGLIACALVIAIGSPWMVKNYWYTQNPLFPFAGSVFHMKPEYAKAASVLTDYYGDSQGFSFRDGAALRRFLDRFNEGFDRFSTRMRECRADLLALWMILAVLVAVLLRLRWPMVLQVFLALGLLAIPLFVWTPGRFLVGFYPVYVLFLIETLRRATRRRRRAFAALAVGLLALYGWTFAVYNCRTRAASLSAMGGPILSAAARERWLVEHDASYRPVRRANALLGPADRLLAAGSFGALAWIDVPFLPNPHTLAPPLPAMLWDRFHDLDAIRQWLRSERITHILIARPEAEAIESQSGFVTRWMEPLFAENSFVLYRMK